MTVRLEHDVVHLEGTCPVEDAEMLLSLLQADRSRPVDISRIRSLHAAVLQVLLTYSAPLCGECDDPFLNRWIFHRWLHGKAGARYAKQSAGPSGRAE